MSVSQYNVTLSSIFSSGGSSSAKAKNFSPSLFFVSSLSKTFPYFESYQLSRAKGLALSTDPIVAALVPCSKRNAEAVSMNSVAF